TLATLSSYDTLEAGEGFGTSMLAGASAGGFVTIRLNRHLVFQPEAAFVQKGALLTDPRSGNEQARTHLNYLEVPLLLRWEGAGGRMTPYLVLGPALGFALGAHVDASASGVQTDVDVSDEVRAIDSGLALGAGIDRGRWGVGARVVQGLIDIGNSTRVDRAVRTRTVTLLATIRF